MLGYISLGPVPAEEDCAQVGETNYTHKATYECRRYAKALRTKYPPPPGARVGIKSFPHDFGSYHEVVVEYDPENGLATEYAFRLEGSLPSTWAELEE